PLRFAIGRRHRKYSETAQKPHLIGVARTGDMLHRIRQAILLDQLVHDPAEKLVLIGAEITANAQLCRRASGIAPQEAKRIGQNVDALFSANTGEVTNAERQLRAQSIRLAVSLEIEARIDDVDFLAGQIEIAGHEIGVVATGGDEAVNLL